MNLNELHSRIEHWEDLRTEFKEWPVHSDDLAAALTVGSARMVEETVHYLALGGRLNIFAGIYPKEQVQLDPNQIHYGEWIITGSSDSTPENMHRALTLIATGQVKTEALVSHVLPLEELARGFDMVKNRAGHKILIQVNPAPMGGG